MDIFESRLRRSVLYVPATNTKALSKISSLTADAVILDLEDAVAPEQKTVARENLCRFFEGHPKATTELIIRVNELSGDWGRDDLKVACACAADAILLPKVNGPADIMALRTRMDEHGVPDMGIWAMIETAKGVLNLASIVAIEGVKLRCLVAGTNDIAKETRVRVTADRRHLTAWLRQIVLAARAAGLDALDGVNNNFRDLQAFSEECVQARDMGFDGKTLIHPLQIDVANREFSPTEAEIVAAEAIVAAFEEPGNLGRGVISMGGVMVELLHLQQARMLLSRR